MENVSGNLASEAERQLISKAKKEHRATTASAERALEVVVTTAEVARGTLVELHRQGQQLQIADDGVAQIHEEVKEASSLVRFMKRLCCVSVATSCCACADPDRHRDATRKARVKQMKQRRQDVAWQASELHAAKQKHVDELIRKAHTGEPRGEAAARDELFGETDTIRAQRARQAVEDRIGRGLPEADHDELRCETRKQEQCLEQIEAAMGALAIVSKAMQENLEEQMPHLDRLATRTEAAHDGLRAVELGAARLAGRAR